MRTAGEVAFLHLAPKQICYSQAHGRPTGTRPDREPPPPATTSAAVSEPHDMEVLYMKEYDCKRCVCKQLLKPLLCVTDVTCSFESE